MTPNEIRLALLTVATLIAHAHEIMIVLCAGAMVAGLYFEELYCWVTGEDELYDYEELNGFKLRKGQ